MRLVVEVPDDLMARFREAVAKDQRTQADVIRAAIREYLRTHGK